MLKHVILNPIVDEHSLVKSHEKYGVKSWFGEVLVPIEPYSHAILQALDTQIPLFVGFALRTGNLPQYYSEPYS